jgi:HEPN domain-containing protein
MLLGRWRGSIVKLVRLSDCNRSVAKRYLDVGKFKEAVETAATSVENIARALLHCYGEKPDVGSGQEEALRLLSRRFHDAEKEDFERAVNEVACIHCNRTVLRHVSAGNIETPQFDKEKAEQILESASRVSEQFKQIMDNHFATEIPELRDVCPRCHSHNFNASDHRLGTTIVQCNSCLYIWNLPPVQ